MGYHMGIPQKLKIEPTYDPAIVYPKELQAKY
jgi:hypothetical protein